MADEIGKGSLYDSLKSETGNHSNNTNANHNLETINLTESMEVHHHAHTSHGKKTWKNYFWEFLMLFLAVFCGFLAEYQLEHKIEHDREKQYIKTMVADMKEDEVKIKYSIIYCKTQVAAFDSILQNIYHTPYTDSSLRVLYYLQRRYAINKNTVSFTKGTITQLKNSGGLRLIRNEAVADSIISYNEAFETTEYQADYFANIRLGKMNEFAIQLFDNEYLINYDRNTVQGILKTKSKIELLNNDPKLVKEYANTVYFAKGTLSIYIELIKRLENRIPKMAMFLENKYPL